MTAPIPPRHRRSGSAPQLGFPIVVDHSHRRGPPGLIGVIAGKPAPPERHTLVVADHHPPMARMPAPSSAAPFDPNQDIAPDRADGGIALLGACWCAKDLPVHSGRAVVALRPGKTPAQLNLLRPSAYGLARNHLRGP